MPFAKGNTVNVGRTYSPAHRRAIAESQIGRKYLDEVKAKLSASHVGLKHPNRKSPGPLSLEHRAAISAALMGKPLGGHAQSEKTRKKISESMRGLRRPEMTIVKMRLAQMDREPFGKSWDTKPERKVAGCLIALFPGMLRNREVPGARGVGIIRRIDFVSVDTRVAVEVDGCYWHGCECHRSPRPDAVQLRSKDRAVTCGLVSLGWAVVRVWEHDVSRFVELCNALHRAVCAGSVTLAEAQSEIATNWYAAYKQMEAAK